MSIIVNLHDIADGKELWSQQFSGVPKDVLSIEDQISTQLVSALQVKPTDDEMARASERPTDNVDAYDLYLRGRQALEGAGPRPRLHRRPSITSSRPSKRIPGSRWRTQASPTRRSRCTRTTRIASGRRRPRQRPSGRSNSRTICRKFTSPSGASTRRLARPPRPSPNSNRGLKLAPNSDTGYIRLGQAYAQAGQQEEAIATFKKGIDVNPYYWVLHNELGRAYFSIGQNEKALEEFQTSYRAGAR